MTRPVAIEFIEPDAETLAGLVGRIAVVMPPNGVMDPLARRLNRVMRGALGRACEGEAFGKLKPGEGLTLAYPSGLAAEAVHLVKLARKPAAGEARKAGAAMAAAMGEGAALTVLAAKYSRVEEIACGIALRAYAFTAHKSKQKKPFGPGRIAVTNATVVAEAAAPRLAVVEGVFFTRDLVSEPANVLTTSEFATRLEGLGEIGVKVEILDEPALEKLGMGALLGVGAGSQSPTKVVVMQWLGGKKDARPFALVGKGVVFDSGGISLKPGAGMEDMTMDMGGAGVVAGVIRALALRKAQTNVVGVVGIVENMPGARAQRPGDVVTSMKGDTIEVINTDAEGRLVLADVLWYAQERFKPVAMINLATLTGAIIIGLGHENAGVFSNDDALCTAFLKAAKAEDEGAWRMPMGEAYDKALKSRIADMKNVGGRPAGSITAAEFLHRFVKPETPWCHLDIAGVALLKSASAYAPKGATGWGVRALERLIRERFEN